MKLSTKSRYGLRILVQMAMDNIQGEKLSRGRSISERQEITEPYLEQIMIPLKQSGIVRTVRGCNGGYELGKTLDEISVLDIMELFDGRINFADCSVGNKKCKRRDMCPTAYVWEHLNDVLREEAAGITLSTIIENFKNYGVCDYII